MYHHLNEDCKIIKPYISIVRGQQEHHESAMSCLPCPVPTMFTSTDRPGNYIPAVLIDSVTDRLRLIGVI